jgi:signal transduction histidine kinase
LSGDSQGTLFEDHAQTVWLGLDRVLLAYRNGRFFEIRGPDGSSLRQNDKFPITEDADGNIWALASSGHLFRIQGREVLGDIQLGESLSSAFLLEADKSGDLWIGAKAGMIARYHAGQVETYSLMDDKDPISIHEMIVDTDNSLLISTERGLVRWSNGQHTALGMKNGLPCESIYSAIKDDNGSLWLYARCGLLQIEASQVAKWEGSPTSPISARVFDAHDGAFPGLQSARQHISSKAPDGRLWFTNGVLVQVVDPKHLSRNEVMPPVAIEDVIADRKMLTTQAGMRVPALTRDLQIDYTALSFSVPQKVRFRYILEGHDTVWQEPGGRRQAYYTDLKPGKYSFRVIASNNDGVWNQQGASLDFRVMPAWYQTLWFMLLFGVIVLATAWALYCLRVRQVAHALAARFDERLAERTRIAREFHDTLIQTIQGSKLVADDALDQSVDPAKMHHALQQLSEWLGRAIQEGRSALNSLRTSATETNDLAEGLRRATEECRMFSSMETSFSVEGNPKEMHPVVRDEIYRIGYEAIRNASAHSKASQLHVGLRYGQDLAISVGDNGVGIPESILNGGTDGHYGLQGMRERAVRIGGKLRIASSAESGTEVSLVIPGRIAFRGTGSNGIE